jgi:hypothetical protein
MRKPEQIGSARGIEKHCLTVEGWQKPTTQRDQPQVESQSGEPEVTACELGLKPERQA